MPEGVSLDDGLSRDEAVAVALWNHGPLQLALANLGFARADLVQAGMLPNPVFTALLPVGPKQLEFYGAWDISFLWQRGRRVDVASRNMRTVAEQLTATGLDLARDVRIAHAECLRAQARSTLSAEAVGVFREIARATEVQVVAGVSNQPQLRNAQTDARMAEIVAQQDVRGVEQAKARLSQLLGLPLERALPALTTTAAGALPPSLESLHAQASAARPELRAAEVAVEAAAAQVGLAKRQAYQLTAMLDTNGTPGADNFQIGPGARFALPILDFNQGGKERAQAQVEQAAWGYVAARQRVLGEVAQAHARLTAASEALARWPAEVVEPTEASMRDAERAFDAGATSYLVVLDGARRWLDARTRNIELEAEVRRAHAELARAVGRDFDDAQ